MFILNFHVMKTTQKILASALLLLVSTFAYAQIDKDRDLQQFRPRDQRGINSFEALDMTPEYDGFKVRLGGSFAVQFQGLDHSTGTTADTLASIGDNFNLPTANLDLDVAMTDGVRLHLRTYLSSRHHPDSWVKGGYVQISKLDFIQEDFLKSVMDITTVKLGLMELNYGDYHFRRTDNSRGIYNPFVGNLIMDAFSTEAGAEVYVTPGDFLFMAGITNGNLNQSVVTDGNQTPAILGKAGWDSQINDDLRLRLTASLYTSGEGQTNFLYFGDRAGSRYYMVMEGQSADPTANFRSGRVNPSMINEVTAIMVNPFVKFKGLEFFGTYENTSGKISGEAQTRNWDQLHGELLYRFGGDEQFYGGVKYNTLSGELPNFNPNGAPDEVTIDRIAAGAGWYMTPNMLVKAEYVNQTYDGYPQASLNYQGEFDGFMLEAVISF